MRELNFRRESNELDEKLLVMNDKCFIIIKFMPLSPIQNKVCAFFTIEFSCDFLSIF